MKTSLIITLSSAFILTITALSFNSFSDTTITTEAERIKYEKFINEHEYSQVRYTQEEIEGMPKRDRPDLAWEQDYLATMNPALGRPEREKLFPVLAMTKTMQQALTSSAPGNVGSPWVERGPDNVGGRTRALAWDPSSVNKVWSGSVTGGLWYNNNITSVVSSWQSVNDFWDNIAVTAIAFDPTNSNTIYIGTGEGWGAASSRGAGIWKSTNGGTSFSQISSTTGFYYINDLVIRNEGGNGVIYAAVAAKYYQGQFHGSANEGLQRSSNGGTSWTQELPNVSGSPEAPTDLDIAANNTIFVGVDANVYGDGGGKIYSSTSGTTFTLRHTHSSPGRVNLSCAPSDANYVYAAFEVSSIMSAFKRSTNGGASWIVQSEPSDVDTGIPNSDFTRGQAWYDLSLDVDPNNRDAVIIGGIDLFKTTNGGGAWTQISKWSNNNNLAALSVSTVHADQHAIVYKPGSSTRVLIGNDGGVYYSSNGNLTTPSLNARINDYNVTQFYACAIHPLAGSNIFLAGAQDNGTQRYTNSNINSTTEVVGGDGAFCHIDQTNGAYQIASAQRNSIYHSSNSGVTFSNIVPSGGVSGKFINPTDLDNNLNILYAARDQTSLHRISNTQSGSPTVSSFTIANLGSGASHLSVSPYTTSTTTLFVGTDGGRVFKLTNAQGTETTTEITGGSFPTGSVSCIAFGANENELLVTFSNYGVNSVWYTSNGGSTWFSKEGNLPDMPVRSALFNPNDYTEVILATEVGVWTTTNLNSGSPSWSTSNSGLANVRVDMLQMRTSDNEVIAATHGRGLFSSDGFNSTTFTANFSASNTTPTTAQTVIFTDSSVPLPTGWTWSFSPSTITYQGGTNASSQNPQVTFNNTGAYTATLLATNATTNDTEIKTNYINVTTVPITTCHSPFDSLYTMGFEAGEDLSGWLTNDANSDANTWGLVNISAAPQGALSGTQAMWYNWNTNGTTPGNDWVFTDCFSLIPGVSYTFSFYWSTGAGYNENVEFFAGTSQTVAGMTTSLRNLSNVSNNTSWTLETINFTANVTGDFYFGWHNTSIANQWYFALEDVNLVGTPTPSTITWSNQPASTTINCDASSLPSNTGTALANTTCLLSGAALSISYSDATAAGSCVNASTITRTWTAIDSCGSSESFNQIITIIDNTNPIISCPSTQSQNAANGVNTPLNNYTTLATISDNCSSNANITVTQSPLAGSTQNVGSVTVTLTATDECGNTANCNFNVTITGTNISWSSQPGNTTINCDASILPANTGSASATTSCGSGGLSVNYSDVTAAGSCVNASIITRTWTATDNCSSNETFNQTITIIDNTNPIISCPATQFQTASNGVNTALNNYTTMATISDNCSSNANITVSQSPSPSSMQNFGTVTVTLTATDECGNTANCSFNVTITGASISWMMQPTNTTINCDASSVPANTGTATASTSCGSGGLSINYSDATVAGSCVNASIITRTWTATDNCSNNETYVQTITIVDNTNPVITCPSNQTQNATNGVNTPLNNYISMATISDNCSSNANITVTQSPSPSSMQNVGTVSVTLTATDECGNTSSCNFNVTITGVSSITWISQPNNITINCDDSSLPANTGIASGGSSCASGGLSVNSSDVLANGSCPNSSFITRTWTATDNCGNNVSFNQLITIQDTTNPIITCPANQFQYAPNGTDTVLLDYTSMATFGDNCSSNANITITQTPAIGSTQNVGTTSVSITATDECGNSASCSFNVDIISTVGIADNTRVNISIFPNPNSGLFTIDLGSEMIDNIHIQVYNLLGEVVYNQENSNANSAYILNLQHVEKGIYYVSLKSEKESIVKKIMIL